MKDNSIIIQALAKLLIPFVLIFGVYIVIGGADSVGGGFQGGAVLSAVFMLKYLITPTAMVRISILRATEKILMLAFIVLVIFAFATTLNMGEKLGNIWMIALNIIIATKVCCGLSIIFFRYVFYEGK